MYGLIDGQPVVFTSNNAEQIAAFIMANQDAEVTITKPIDTLVLTTVHGGFIMKCPDQTFLVNELIPVLSLVQWREKKSPEFKPLVIEDDCDYLN